MEDDEHDALLVRSQLSDGDFETQLDLVHVSTLAEAKAALRQARADRGFDAVLLDLGLADSTGLVTYERVAEFTSLPVVVLSGDIDRDVAMAAVRAGAQDFLVKGLVTGEAVARVLRYAVERHRLLEQERARTRRERRLAGLAQMALATGDPGPVLDAAVKVLADVLEVGHVHVLQRVEGGFHLRVGVGWDRAASAVLVSPGRKSWAGFAELSSAPVLVEDADDEDRFELGELLGRHDLRSGVVVPIRVGDGTWGVFGAFSTAPGAVGVNDIPFVTNVAALVGATVRRWQSEVARGERVKELTALRGVAHASLRNELSKSEMARHVCAALLPAFQFPEATVVAVTIEDQGVTLPDDGQMEVALSSTIVVDGVSRGEVVVGYAHELPFLAEEQELLDAVAESVSVWIARHEAMSELEASRRRLELTLSQLPAIVYTLDDQLKLTSLTGHKAFDLDGAGWSVGARIEELLGENGTTLSAEALAAHRAALSGEATEFAVQVDGGWWEGAVERLKDLEGATIGVLGLAMDATERREQAEALAASRARLQALFDHASEAILLLDDDMRFLDVNAAGVELLGCSRDELLRLAVPDFLPEYQREGVAEALETLRERGRFAGETELVRKDGSIVIVDYRAVSDIQPGWHLSIMRDITDQVRAQHALRRSEERFRRLSENAAEGIMQLRVEPEPEVEYINPAMQTITGFSAAELRADRNLLNRRLHPNDRDKLTAALESGDEVTQPVLLRFQRADDEWIWLELHVSTMFDHQGRRGSVQYLLVDVTDRKRRQEALEEALTHERMAAQRLKRVDELKSRLLGAVSHQLRTPLTGVYGGAVTLQNNLEMLSDLQRGRLIDCVARNAERLRQVMNDLHDVEHLGEELINVERVHHDLSDLVRSAASLVSLPDHAVEVDLTPEPTPVLVDASKIAKIVTGLLDNARKHTPAGTRVWVRTSCTDGGALLTVEDDGPGIPEGLEQTIFEPFQQGPGTDDDPNPGTGIGLTLVSRLVELHGGRLWVEHRPGGGSRFRVQLPIVVRAKAHGDG